MLFKVLACMFLLVSSAAYAQPQRLPEIAVEAEQLIEDKAKVSIKSETLPSQVQIITKEDIERLDAKDFLDIFRKTPGVHIRPYVQGDVGNGFQIRGHGMSHGQNVAIFIDGVPQNFPSVAQGGNGMAEVSWLTPELIERIEIIKGPFSALYGNFALGGVVNIITKRKDTSPSISVSGGSFGAYRGLGIISNEAWQPIPLVSLEHYSIDGYRHNSDYKKTLSFNKITLPILDGNLSARLSYYKSDWRAAGWLRINEVRDGTVSRTSAFNPTDNGEHERYTLAINYTPRSGEEGLYMDAYIEGYEKHRIAQFRGSGQTEQEDDRMIYGGKVYYNLVPADRLAITPGIEIRYDDGDARVYPTTNGQRTGNPTSDWGIKQLNLSAFLQAQAKVIEQIKLVGGVRYDYFNIDVQNRLTTVPADYSGEADMGIFTPRIGLVVMPFKNLNIFANKGMGLRSPAASEMSPNTAARAKNFDLKPAKVHSWDAGFNTTLFEKLYLAFSYYQTEMEREIRIVGNNTNTGDSKRNGYEIETKFYATPELALFANYSWLDAEWKDPIVAGQQAGQYKIADLPEHLISGGIEITKQTGKDRKLLLDLYYSYIGSGHYYVGTETTPRKTPVYDRYTAKATYKLKNWSAFVSTVYQPREYASDGMYSSGGFVYFNPKPVWDVNAGIKYKF